MGGLSELMSIWGASQSTYNRGSVDNRGGNSTGHLESLSIFYSVKIELLLLFIFITVSEGFNLFNIDVNR